MIKQSALIRTLTVTKRTAVIECFHNNGLEKRGGCWIGRLEGIPIAGGTVADLARDGLLSIVTNRLHGSARLTELGQYLAENLIATAADEAKSRE